MHGKDDLVESVAHLQAVHRELQMGVSSPGASLAADQPEFPPSASQSTDPQVSAPCPLGKMRSLSGVAEQRYPEAMEVQTLEDGLRSLGFPSQGETGHPAGTDSFSSLGP